MYHHLDRTRVPPYNGQNSLAQTCLLLLNRNWSAHNSIVSEPIKVRSLPSTSFTNLRLYEFQFMAVNLFTTLAQDSFKKPSQQPADSVILSKVFQSWDDWESELNTLQEVGSL